MNSNAELIVRFYNNENYLNWENLFNRTSILRITKADRFEETHSLFIRYLLNPNENHGLGTKALEMFIRLLLVKNNKNNVLSKLSNELILKDKILRVPVLVPEKTDKRSRYDIYIEFESNNTKATI